MATYEIIIRNAGGSGEGGQKPVSTPNEQDSGQRGKAAADNASSAGKSAYGLAKRAATMQASHMINTVSLRTGHAELQQRYQMAYDIGSRVFNLGESIMMGALVGGAGGAIVGAVTGLAFQGIALAQQFEERQWRMQEESVGISLANIRAGLGRNVR